MNSFCTVIAAVWLNVSQSIVGVGMNRSVKGGGDKAGYCVIYFIPLLFYLTCFGDRTVCLSHNDRVTVSIIPMNLRPATSLTHGGFLTPPN